jgi:hypothetical protein
MSEDAMPTRAMEFSQELERSESLKVVTAFE